MARSARFNTVLVWVVLSLIWGSTWAAIKIGLADLPPIRFAFIRFVLAFFALAVVLIVRRTGLPKREHWPLIVKTGLLQFFFNYGLIFWGERFISSGLTAVLQSTIPLFGFVMAHHQLEHERLSLKRIAGLLLGIAGVAVIFADQLRIGSIEVVWGSCAILVSAWCAAEASILVKTKAKTIDSAQLVASQMLVGLIPLFVYTVFVEGDPLSTHWTLKAIGALVYLALIGTVAAFMLFYWLVRQIDVTSTQLISLVTPFIAVIIGVLFLHEQMNARLLLGGVGILSGITIILWSRKRVIPHAGSEAVDSLEPIAVLE